MLGRPPRPVGTRVFDWGPRLAKVRFKEFRYETYWSQNSNTSNIQHVQGVPVLKVMFQLALTERNIQFQVNLVSFSWSWIAEISARWIFFRFFYLTQPLQPQTEMVYNLCKKYGFLSINSTKNGCFVSRNKKDIILSAFLEEKRDSSLLRPQRLLRL